jgi:hypothetical protein
VIGGCAFAPKFSPIYLHQSPLLLAALPDREEAQSCLRRLMIGEFHSISNATVCAILISGRLQPVPLLSIRNMVEVDFAFLNRTYDPAPLRVRFLRSYLHYVGRELGYLSRSKVEAALQQAEEQALQPA